MPVFEQEASMKEIAELTTELTLAAATVVALVLVAWQIG